MPDPGFDHVESILLAQTASRLRRDPYPRASPRGVDRRVVHDDGRTFFLRVHHPESFGRDAPNLTWDGVPIAGAGPRPVRFAVSLGRAPGDQLDTGAGRSLLSHAAIPFDQVASSSVGRVGDAFGRASGGPFR